MAYVLALHTFLFFYLPIWRNQALFQNKLADQLILLGYCLKCVYFLVSGELWTCKLPSIETFYLVSYSYISIGMQIQKSYPPFAKGEFLTRFLLFVLCTHLNLQCNLATTSLNFILLTECHRTTTMCAIQFTALYPFFMNWKSFSTGPVLLHL